jgi:carboxylesterase type B
MVWIHGGGFLSLDGSTKSFGPNILMNFDVILVIQNAE